MAVAASEFVQAKNNLITARAQVTLTTASEKRQHELYLAKAGALKDWLQSQSDLATAEGNLQAARNQFSIMGKSEHEISAFGSEASVGLLPAAFSNGIGSQVQKPLALVVVGGILLAPVLVLIILSLLNDLFSIRKSLLKNEGAVDTAEVI